MFSCCKKPQTTVRMINLLSLPLEPYLRYYLLDLKHLHLGVRPNVSISFDLQTHLIFGDMECVYGKCFLMASNHGLLLPDIKYWKQSITLIARYAFLFSYPIEHYFTITSTIASRSPGMRTERILFVNVEMLAARA